MSESGLSVRADASSAHRSAAVRVLVVDDHLMFAQSLVRLLEDEDDIVVTGIATTIEAARAAAARDQPDVVLLDYCFPEGDGVRASAAVRDGCPDARLVMLTASTEDETLLDAIHVGCSGFLTKDRAAAEVATTVRAAHSGDLVMPLKTLSMLQPGTSSDVRGRPELSEREHEVLAMLAEGVETRAIAATLCLSVNTVRNHVQGILNKLGAHSKLEAVAIARRTGLLATRPRSL